MKSSGIPDRLPNAFAHSGDRNDIADTSTTASLADGQATYDVGFPPLTRTAIASGGIPPSGLDVNGVLYDVTNKLQWHDAGGGYPFDAAFSNGIGGYPKGAVVPSSDLTGYWLNTTDANGTNPEGTAASVTGWVPLDFYGLASVSLASVSVTMNCLDAAKPIIVLKGTLTANVYLYLPKWQKRWRIVNNCTGSFNVILSTTGGSVAPAIATGYSYEIYCDGIGVYLLSGKLATKDSLTATDVGALSTSGGELTGAVSNTLGFTSTSTGIGFTATGVVSSGSGSSITYTLNGYRLFANTNQFSDTYWYNDANGSRHGIHVHDNSNDVYYEFFNNGDLKIPRYLYAGTAVYQNDGNVKGSLWGGYLSDYLNNALAACVSNVQLGTRVTISHVSSMVTTPTGCVATSASGDSDNDVNAQYAPIQIYRNGVWATIAG